MTEIISFEIPPDLEDSKMNVVLDDGRTFEIDITAIDNHTGGSIVQASVDEDGELFFMSSYSNHQRPVSPSESQNSDNNTIGYCVAAIGGAIGTLVAGPVVGIVIGGMSFVAASKNKTKLEQVKDHIITSPMTVSMQNQVKSVDESYHISKHFEEAKYSIQSKALEIDATYEIKSKLAALSDQVMVAADTTKTYLSNVDTTYHITDRVDTLSSAVSVKTESLVEEANSKINCVAQEAEDSVNRLTFKCNQTYQKLKRDYKSAF